MTGAGSNSLVSVVIPIYNESDSIRGTLDSLLSQTYDNVQLIPVDDGSTDDSLQVVKARLEAADGDRHIVLRNATNLGQSFSRNRGMMHAEGEFVVFHDADDLSTPDRIAKQVEFLTANDEVGVVGGGYFYLNPRRNQREVKLRPTSDADIRRRMAQECMINLGTAMFRREALLDTNLFESRNVEGYELVVNVAQRWELANLPEPIYLYRINEGSRSQEDQLRKKSIIAYRSYQAIRKLNLSYWYLPLQLGWLLYMTVPERVQTLIRRWFSPTRERELSEDEEQMIRRLEQFG